MFQLSRHPAFLCAQHVIIAERCAHGQGDRAHPGRSNTLTSCILNTLNNYHHISLLLLEVEAAYYVYIGRALEEGPEEQEGLGSELWRGEKCVVRIGNSVCNTARVIP